MMTPLLIVCLILLPMRGAKASLTKVCYGEPGGIRRGVCGPQLPNLIRLVCGGIYQRPGKRSGNENENALAPITVRDHETSSSPRSQAFGLQNIVRSKTIYPGKQNKAEIFLPRFKAQAVLKHKRSKWSSVNPQMGIVCECCVHRCELREMGEYCGQDSSDMYKRAAIPPTPDPAFSTSKMMKLGMKQQPKKHEHKTYTSMLHQNHFAVKTELAENVDDGYQQTSTDDLPRVHTTTADP